MDRGRTTDHRRRARPARGAATAVLGGLALLGGCGSASVAELPPAAGPDRSPAATASPAGTVTTAAATTLPGASERTRSTLREGSLTAVLDPKARELSIVATPGGQVVSTATAGVGPTQVACAPQGPCFVVDTQGDALLVFRVGEGGRSLRLTRRVYVDGAPYAIAIDAERRRLWVTLTARNEVVELGAHGRPHILQRLPTIRQPDAVAVDETTGDVTIASPAGERQVIPDPASGDR